MEGTEIFRLRNVRGQSGSVLPLALGLLILLTIIAAEIIAGYGQTLLLYKRVDWQRKLRSMAISGISAGEWSVMRRESEDVLAPLGYFAYDESVLETRHLLDKNADSAALNSSNWYRIEDEQGKLNVNKAALAELARVPGISPVMAQSIITLRSGGINDGSTRLPDAKNGKQKNTSPMPAGISCLDDLLLIKGFKCATLDTLSRFLTVYGDGKINANSCSYETLVALGFDEDFSVRFIEMRNGRDGVSNTIDDIVFASLNAVWTEVNAHIMMDDKTKNLIRGLLTTGRLKIGSDVYRIESAVRLKPNETRKTVTAVIAVNDETRPTFLFWNEN